MSKTVIIDYLPESAIQYQDYAIVAIDVIRATTTAITASSMNRRCYPTPSINDAVPLAARLDNPLLAGELGGITPEGFDITNSPVAVSERTDVERPMILLSSSGTRLIHTAQNCEEVYLACFRNFKAVADYLKSRHQRIAVIGAGTRGEFREEDQMCCAWIAEMLLDSGYAPEDARTIELVNRWHGAPSDACTVSNSAKYLRSSGQQADLEFVISHVNDIQTVYMMQDSEIVDARTAGYSIENKLYQ